MPSLSGRSAFKILVLLCAVELVCQDISLFSQGLAANGWRTPQQLMDALEEFTSLEPEKQKGPAALLTQTPEGGQIFRQMTWAGKLSVAAVMKVLVDNKEKA